MNRQQMIEQLKSAVCVVEFTKVNGDRREMTCTLNEAHTPVYVVKEGAKPKPVNEEVVSVYDINAKGWRSFRVANVTNFTAQETAQ